MYNGFIEIKNNTLIMTPNNTPYEIQTIESLAAMNIERLENIVIAEKKQSILTQIINHHTTIHDNFIRLNNLYKTFNEIDTPKNNAIGKTTMKMVTPDVDDAYISMQVDAQHQYVAYGNHLNSLLKEIENLRNTIGAYHGTLSANVSVHNLQKSFVVDHN